MAASFIMSNNNHDIGASFNKLVNQMFFNHHGILVERDGNKFKWAGRSFDTLEDLDKYREVPNPGIKVALPENKKL